MKAVARDWYDGFFEGEWLDELALYRPDERTQKEVEFIVDRLELEPGERILDVACGHGRIAVELARRGFRVTGVDLSPRSLELARSRAEEAGVEVGLVHRDMREIDFDGEFDAAINVFTSFGYFDDDSENQRALDAMAQALRPGGRFLIDVVNILSLARRYRQRWWDELESGNGILVEEHEYDFLRGRNAARWTFVRDDGGRSELLHSVRTYTPAELARMFRTAGLTVAGAWGDFDGAELSFDSSRLILRGDKPQA